MFRLRKLLRLKQDNKGAAAIEAALTFPFLLLLARASSSSEACSTITR
jgi:Flp pilus assembly protein TadG